MSGNGLDVEDFIGLVNEYLEELEERTGAGNEDIIINLVNSINYLAGGQEDIIEMIPLEAITEEYRAEASKYSIPLSKAQKKPKVQEREMYSDKQLVEDFAEGTEFLQNIIDLLLEDRAYLQGENDKLKTYIKGEI